MDRLFTRKYLKISIAALAVLVILGSLASRYLMKSRTKRYSSSFSDVFDTVSVLTAYSETEEEFQEAAELAHETLRHYHQLFDIYHDYDGLTNLKTVNENAAGGPVRVGPEIMELLQFGKQMYELSGGKLNIAYGSVLRLWHEKREAGTADPDHALLPGAEELTEASRHTDIDDVILDTENMTVFFRDPALKLDVGGIAKGYAVEKTGEKLEEEGAASLLLNIGGNLKAIGERGDGQKWLCPVQDPSYVDTQTGEPYAVETRLKDLSLVTSGDYERYYTVEGKRYCHIIDPDTMYPPDRHRSVSVLMRDSSLADGLSTALFMMSAEEGRGLLQALHERNPEEKPEAMWVEADGQKIYTDGFLQAGDAEDDRNSAELPSR